MSEAERDRRISLEATVNGHPVPLRLLPEELLLDVLRDHLGLTGSKRSCDVQVCGACTVSLDVRPVSACSVLVYEARGRPPRRRARVPAHHLGADS